MPPHRENRAWLEVLRVDLKEWRYIRKHRQPLTAQPFSSTLLLCLAGRCLTSAVETAAHCSKVDFLAPDRPITAVCSRPIRSVPSAGSWAGVAGEQGDEHLRVGASPAGHRVPPGRGLITGDGLRGERHRVAARGYVVKRLVVGGAAADLVQGGIDEAKVPAGVLVG